MVPDQEPPVARFTDALDGNGLRAIRMAMRYMMRGAGVYRPDPKIVGIDKIHVVCIREFGTTMSPREVKRLFEVKWNDTYGQLDIKRTFKKPPYYLRTDHEFHDWYLKQWLDQAKRLSTHDDTTGVYEVLFAGNAGVWSSIFIVSCSSISNQPITVLRSDIDSEIID
jgi:hypothetical protein